MKQTNYPAEAFGFKSDVELSDKFMQTVMSEPVRYPDSENEYFLIEDFPDYVINRAGVVRNLKNGKRVAADSKHRHNLYIGDKRQWVANKDLMKYINSDKTMRVYDLHRKYDANENENSLEFWKNYAKECLKEADRMFDIKERAMNDIFTLQNMLAERYKKFGWDPTVEDFIKDIEERNKKRLNDYFLAGAESDDAEYIFVDPETLCPMINPFCGAFLGWGVTYNKVCDIIDRKYKKIRDAQLEEIKPYIEQYNKREGEWGEAAKVINKTGYYLGFMLMGDPEYRELMNTFRG